MLTEQLAYPITAKNINQRSVCVFERRKHDNNEVNRALVAENYTRYGCIEVIDRRFRRSCQSAILKPLLRHYYTSKSMPPIYSQESCKIYHLFCNFFHFFCISDQNAGFQLTYRPYYLCLCWLSPFSAERYRILRSICRTRLEVVAATGR